jgi:hypothetical protein
MISLNSFIFEDKNDLLTCIPLEWTNALLLVNKSKDRVTGGRLGATTLGVMNGYAYPPPSLFANVQNPFHFLVTWIIMSPRWAGEVNMGTNAITRTSAPSKDTWKKGLRAMVGRLYPNVSQSNIQPNSAETAENTTTGAKRRRKQHTINRTREKLQIAQETFNFMGDIDLSTVQNVAWSGVPIVTDGNVVLTPLTAKLCVWEAGERNFRAEMLVLDRILAENQWSEDLRVARESQILALFPAQRMSPSLPLEPDSASIFGSSCADTQEIMDHWWDILASWEIPSVSPIFQSQKPAIYTSAIKTDLIHYYIDKFFVVFGRCPTIPCQFPMDAGL